VIGIHRGSVRRLGAEVDPLQSRVLGASRNAATLGDRPPVDLLEIAGEVDGAGLADRAADSKRIDRGVRGLEDLDPLLVEAA
jgi:hypothetical protein